MVGKLPALAWNLIGIGLKKWVLWASLTWSTLVQQPYLSTWSCLSWAAISFTWWGSRTSGVRCFKLSRQHFFLHHLRCVMSPRCLRYMFPLDEVPELQISDVSSSASHLLLASFEMCHVTIRFAKPFLLRCTTLILGSLGSSMGLHHIKRMSLLLSFVSSSVGPAKKTTQRSSNHHYMMCLHTGNNFSHHNLLPII